MDNECGCNVGVIKSTTLSECPNKPLNPNGANGPFVVKIPVVIAEPLIQIVVEASIELKEPALEIKRIKKNLFIDQCKLIDLRNGSTGKLFISGFVRKNIEFATASFVCDEHKSISGDIRHTTVNVPFTCVTEIHYAVPPEITFQENAKEMSLFIEKNIKSRDCCSETIIGRNPCEQNFEHFESFNERVFCELEDVRFFESDIRDNPRPIGCEFEFPTECTFDKLTEKIVILVRLKLLQNQQVNIPGRIHDHEGKGKPGK